MARKRGPANDGKSGVPPAGATDRARLQAQIEAMRDTLSPSAAPGAELKPALARQARIDAIRRQLADHADDEERRRRLASLLRGLMRE